MSAILDCLPGDEVLLIQAFLASPEGVQFSLKTCRRFEVGDRVRYLGAQRQAEQDDRPDGWMVRFEAADGKRYATSHTHVVTEECWHGLVAYFREYLRPPSAGKPPRVMGIG
jgi:hypothetical protein